VEEIEYASALPDTGGSGYPEQALWSKNGSEKVLSKSIVNQKRFCVKKFDIFGNKVSKIFLHFPARKQFILEFFGYFQRKRAKRPKSGLNFQQYSEWSQSS
jgi:hypothetical protein